MAEVLDSSIKQKMTGAQAAVRTLVENGVDTVFGIPGGHSFPMYAALQQESGIRHVLGRHEQGLGYMADGYARMSGRIAAVSITSGPAVANITSALGQATTDTAPILVIASTPLAELVGKNKGGLHDLNNTLDLVESVTRYREHCSTAEEVPEKLASILKRLREERPGGAFIQIPTDVMGTETDVQIPRIGTPSFPEPDASTIAQAAEMLAQAEKPLIIIGTGGMISGAGETVAKLSATLGAVVSTTVLARGTLPGDSANVIFPDGATGTVLSDVFAEADVVLAVGTMFKQEDTCGWTVKMGKRLIHVDIDRNECGRSYEPATFIHSDAKTACEAILNALDRKEPASPEWVAFAKEKQSQRMQLRHESHPEDMAFQEAFREALPRDTALFADRCNIGYWAFRCMPFYGPRTFHYPLGYGGLGGALPQAIGAKLACPERNMVAVLGDGGMQFTLPELAVAVQEQTPITIVVSNNGTYEAIRAGLGKNYPGTTLGTQISNPDYAKIAEAYGIPYAKATDRQGFLSVFKQKVKENQLNLIDFENNICDP